MGINIANQKEKFKKMIPVDMIFDNLDTLIIGLNNDRQIIYHNSALLEYVDEDAIGLKPGDVFNCIHANENIEDRGTTQFCKNCDIFNLIKKTKSGKQNDSECRIITNQSDSIKLLNFSVKSIRYTIDDEDFIVFILKDISELKKGRVLEKNSIN